MLANRAAVAPVVDVGTVHLGSAEQVSRLVRARGGLRPDPSLRGEFARLPVRFKSRHGIALDELAQEVADAQGLPAHRVQDDILRALERTGGPWRRARQQLERVPAGVSVPLEEWRSMSRHEREAAVEFFRAGEALPDTGREHRPRVRVEGHRFRLGLQSPWKGRVTEVNPVSAVRSFAAELRARIRGGESPRAAMRAAWREVRAGVVARPPRRGVRVREAAPAADIGRRARMLRGELSPGTARRIREALLSGAPLPRMFPKKGRRQNPLTDQDEIGGFLAGRRRAVQGLNFADEAIGSMSAAAVGRPALNPMTPLHESNRYLNLLRSAPKRRYGFAYLSWLKGGAVGYEPERAGLSVMGAQAVRMQLHELLGPEPFKAVGANPYRVTAFGERTKRGKRQGYGYDVLGPYDSPTRLPGTGSFTFPDLQSAKRYAGQQFLDPEIHQVAIKTLQDKDVARTYRRRRAKNPAGSEVNPKGRGSRPIRYSQLTEEQRTALVEAYNRARAFTSDALHAAAIAAREVLVRSDREWNGPRGSDAFGAAVGVLAFRRAMKVNPLTRVKAREILKTARGIYRRPLTHAETSMVLKAARGLTAPEGPAARARVAARRGGQRRPLDQLHGNPPLTKLYDRVLEIRAAKGRGGKYPGKFFVHRFSTKVPMYGLPDGRVVIG